MDNRDPDVSFVSSLVPTSKRIPTSTLDGDEADSVNTVIPFANFVTSYFLSYSLISFPSYPTAYLGQADANLKRSDDLSSL